MKRLTHISSAIVAIMVLMIPLAYSLRSSSDEAGRTDRFTFITTAQASTREIFVGVSSCAAGAYLAGELQKLASSIPGLASAVNSALMVPVFDNPNLNAYANKEGMLDIVARCGARAILNQMTGGIMNAAQTKGRDGGASIVQNWRNFMTNAQYRGEDVFRAIVANTQLCSYLKSDIYSIFRTSDRFKVALRSQNIRIEDLDPYTLRAKCSLPNTFDPMAFQRDFAGNGGWQTYTKLLQPENNLYGVLFQSITELSKQRELEVSADLNEVDNGYLAIREGGGANSCSIRSPTSGRCLFYKDIRTTGGQLANSVASAIKAELEWITSTDELSELIASGVEVLMNRVIDSLSSEDGDYLVYNDPIVPTEDICVRKPVGLNPSGSPSPSELNAIRKELDKNLRAIKDTARDSNEMERRIAEFDATFMRAVPEGEDPTVRTATLARLREGIIALAKDEKKGAASSLMGARESLLTRYKTVLGISDGARTCPPDPTPPPAPAPRPSGSPPPSTCAPDTSGCVVNEIGNTCINASYREAVMAAITQYIQSNPDVFEDPDAEAPTIKDGRTQEYMAGVVAILNQQGYSAQVDSEDEIAVKRSGGSFSEGYDILTSDRQVRRFHAATCTPASF